MKHLYFNKYFKSASILSTVLIIISIAFLIIKGLNFGVDFKGGTLIELRNNDNNISISNIRDSFNQMNLKGVTVKQFGNDTDYIIKFQSPEVQSSTYINNLKSSLKNNLSASLEFRRVENVGPKVSSELLRSGVIAISLSLFAMLLYIWIRFEWQFSLGAIVALFHDVILTLGIFSVFSLEINLSIVAAVLTIVGYSMNDTVVIYDRVRDNLRRYVNIKIFELSNTSINETLSRTIITSLTTLLALTAIYLFGGEILRGFSFALIWGVIIGTYSSIFIASPLILIFNVKRDWSEVIDNSP